MPSATRPPLTSTSAKLTDQESGTSAETLRVLDERFGGGLFASLQVVGGQQEQSLRQVELGADEPGFEPDRLLQQLDAFRRPVLLQADRAQHGAGGGSRGGIGERPLGLLIGLREPPSLHEGGRPLEGFSRLAAERGGRREHADQEQGTGTALRSPLRHDYHCQ